MPEAKRIAVPACRLVAIDGRTFPLRSVQLRAEATAGLARTVLLQSFSNPFAEPLTVTVQVPLPSDGAVSGFAFTLGTRRVVGEIARREDAREQFEAALLEGRTAALLEEQRDSLFVQELGNVAPGEEVTGEITVDHPLGFVDAGSGSWEFRFPTVVAPRYLGAPGRVPDAAEIAFDVASESPAHLELELRIGDARCGAPESPSHALRASALGTGFAVAFADGTSVPLDRDVVVRWAVAEPEPGLRLERARPSASSVRSDRAYGLLTIVPPRLDAAVEPMPRDLIVLLDTSGSMKGAPLAHAKSIVAAVVDGLTERDSLELIAFASKVELYADRALPATAAERARSLRWLARLEADGGTEMLAGIQAALRTLREDAQRQVLLVTDGLIGFETEVARAIALGVPSTCRVHAVGIGSAPNRTLLRAVARAGRGIELCVGLDEDPTDASRRLHARTQAPLVTEVEVSGSALAQDRGVHGEDLFARSPARVPLALKPEGGDLTVRGHSLHGPWERALRVEPTPAGEGASAICALWARAEVEQLERPFFRPDRESAIARLGLEFSIATRLTSWIGVWGERRFKRGEPARNIRLPQGRPYGMLKETLAFQLRRALDVQAVAASRRAVSALGRVRGGSRTEPPRPFGHLHLSNFAEADPREFVILLKVIEGTAWDPSEWVTLRLEDGSEVACQFAPEKSHARFTVGSDGGVYLVVRTSRSLHGTPVALVSHNGEEIPLL